MKFIKRTAFGLLTAISLIICCSCSEGSMRSDAGTNLPTTVKNENTDNVELLYAADDLQPEADKNEPQTITKDFDGIVMTVKTDKSEYRIGDLIHVEASVKNTTNENIYLYLFTTTPDSHAEITTEIIHSDQAAALEGDVNDNIAFEGGLNDADTFNKFFDAAVGVLTVEPGKDYVQSMVFETFVGYDSLPRKQARPGLYLGRSAITLLPDSEPPFDLGPSYSLDFSLTLK